MIQNSSGSLSFGSYGFQLPILLSIDPSKLEMGICH